MSARYADMLNSLGASISAAGLRVAVTRGLEAWPARVGRDIDLLVAPRDMADAVRLIEQHFRDPPWQVKLVRRYNGHVWCFLADGLDNVYEIDLVPRLNWGFTTLASVPTPTREHGGFQVDPWAAFAKRVLLQILGDNCGAFVKDPTRLSIDARDTSIVAKRLREFLGGGPADELMAAVTRSDVARLHTLAPRIRRRLILTGLARVRELPHGLTAWVRTEVAASPASRPVFPSIAVVGVDGVGKSTTLDALASAMLAKLPITHIERRHWRPFVLPPLARLAGRSESGVALGGPPRRSGGPFPVLRLGYFALDYLLGRLLRDRRSAVHLAGVLYDRCGLDIIVDPVRFGIRETRGTAAFRHGFARPDIVVLLYDSPTRILNRKPELTRAEILSQQRMWLQLARDQKVDLVYRTRRHPDRVAEDVLRHLIVRMMN